MHEVIDNTDATTDNTLVASVESNLSTPAPRAALSAEDAPYIQRVLEMDIFKDVPSTSTVPANFKFPPLRAAGLPKEQRQEVEAQLEQVSPDKRAELEDVLVGNKLRGMLPSLRVKTGVGANAYPYHKEQVGIAAEWLQLGKQFNDLSASLSEVASYGSETDPETGESRPVEQLRIQGNQRKARLAHMEDINRQMRLLMNDDGSMGLEGHKRMSDAMAETVAMIKSQEAQIEEAAEARLRSAHNDREERINSRAASMSRMGRNVT